MNNKKKCHSFLSIAKQFLAKKRLLLLLPLCFSLVACDKEESKKTQPKQVELLRPYHALAVNLEEEELFVALNSFVRADAEPTEILINGVSCYRYPVAVGTNACHLNYNKINNTVASSFAALQQVLVQGDNTVTVKNLNADRQESIQFYYDSQRPKLEVKTIKLADGQLNDGELNAGDFVDITIRINDPSAIKSVEFYANNKQYPSFTYATEEDAYAQASGLIAKRQALLDWEAEHQVYLDDLERKEFVIKDVEWPRADSAAPQFSYKVVDIHGQKSEGKLAVSGSELVNSQAIQLNNTLFQHIAPVVNQVLSATVSAINITVKPSFIRNLEDDGSGSYIPKLETCTAGSSCATLRDIDTQRQIVAGMDDAVRALCSSLGWPLESATNVDYCKAYIHVDKIKISKPRVTVRGQNSGTFDLKLGVHFEQVSAPFTVYTVDGDSTFTSTLRLNDFEVHSSLTFLPPVKEQGLLRLKRSLIGIYLIPPILGANKQIYLSDSGCSGSRCDLVSSFITPIYNLRLTEKGRVAADDILKQIAQSINDAIPWAPEIPAEIEADNLNSEPSFFEKMMINPQRIRKIVNKQANLLTKAPRNAHFSFYSQSEPQGYSLAVDGDGIVDNPALGMELSNTNSYSYVKNANFPSYEPGINGSLIDFAYAISQDSINQMLLREYQTGLDGNTRVITVTNTNASFFAGESEVCLRVEAKSAPKVKFHGYYSQKLSVGVTFTDKIAENAAKEQAKKWKQLCEDEYPNDPQACVGIEDDYEAVTLLDTSKETVPGSVTLIMDNVELSAKQGPCLDNAQPEPGPWNLADSVPVDITNRLFVTMEAGKPAVKAYNRADDRFVKVRAKKAEHGAIAAEFSGIIGAHVNKALAGFNTIKPLFGENTSIGLDELPILKGILANGDIKDLIMMNIPSQWKVHYGIQFMSFGIEPSGSYLRFTGKVNTETFTGIGCPDNNYFRYFCIKEEKTAQ